MKTIRQRELRNDNAKFMRGLEQGETHAVTRRGVTVARRAPWTDAGDLRCDRPAKERHVDSTQTRVSIGMPTSELLDELRGDR